jgi:5-methyltetrahydropteroyltriglutamate--homocysteine methyltransferase
MLDRPPYRAEHVGSLPRPQELMVAWERFVEGTISRDFLREIEDRAIAAAVSLQERVGIGAVTDGEYRRRGWREFIYERLDGYGPETVMRNFPVTRFDGTVQPPTPEPKVTGRLRRREPLAAAEFEAVRGMTTRPVKANLPTPSGTHFYAGDNTFDHGVYRDRDAMMEDVVRIMREEIADLAARGCSYLQFDEVPLALMCDPKNQAVIRQRGDDPDALIDFYIKATNDALRDRPATMTIGVHLCRGNAGHGMADGGYDPIAERLFNGLDVDGFFLEYDTPRAGDFSPLRFLPAPKKAVLGLISTKLAALETVEALRRRIDEAAKLVPLDRLCLSPQCGFASVPGRVESLSMDDVERKLVRVVEVAHAVWG